MNDEVEKSSAAPRRRGGLIVLGLFAAMAATAAGALLARSKWGPARSCEYGAPGSGCDENQICAVTVGGAGRCLPFTKQAVPMRPPFVSGVTFACRQGPLSPTNRSHAWGTDVYAVDLMPDPKLGEVVVTAPIEGEAHVYDRCEERDASPGATNTSECGAGYGNHVRLWDGIDLVLLGHLARVTVKDGATVKRGDPVGIAGVSGSAGARHVHLVDTRLRPGDHIRSILGSFGHKGGVVVRGLLEVGGPSGAATKAFDELGCAERSETFWTTP